MVYNYSAVYNCAVNMILRKYKLKCLEVKIHDVCNVLSNDVEKILFLFFVHNICKYT